MKQSGFWDSAPVGGAARTQNGKEAEERRTGEERQGPGKRNRRGRVRKEESQRQEERGIAEAGGQVWMVLAWPRPPQREENHDGMLR